MSGTGAGCMAILLFAVGISLIAGLGINAFEFFGNLGLLGYTVILFVVFVIIGRRIRRS